MARSPEEVVDVFKHALLARVTKQSGRETVYDSVDTAIQVSPCILFQRVMCLCVCVIVCGFVCVCDCVVNWAS